METYINKFKKTDSISKSFIDRLKTLEDEPQKEEEEEN